MAFPTNDGSLRASLGDAWSLARARATELKHVVAGANTRLSTIDTPAYEVASLSQRMADFKDQFSTIGAVPGLADYAKAQVDPSIDIVADFNAMSTALSGAITWIRTNFPQDGEGYLLAFKLDANGRIANRLLTPAQTNGLRTQLISLLSTLD